MQSNSKPPLILTVKQRAFVEELLTKNENIIKYTLRKTLGQDYKHLTEECVAELSLLMCEKVSLLEKRSTPSAWIVTSAKFIAFAAIKKYDRYEKSISPLREDISKMDSTFEDALYNIWLQNGAPQKILDALTKREKQVYQKLYIENKDVKTTAEELGVAQSTVRSFNKSIRDKLLEQINKKI